MNILLILSSLFLFVNCQNYCDISPDHIACNNNGEIDKICKSNSNIINLKTDGIQDYIVTTHNAKRNEIALGKLKKFKTAVRMPTMEWDNELAKLAELNVKTCKFGHDKCRDTIRFLHSGQNLGRWAGYPAISVKDAVTKLIERWFDENKDTDMSMINNFQITSKIIGHFTVMVADKNIKLGCGMLRTVSENTGFYFEYLLACNYATTNILNEPIYISGNTASKCQTGKNPKYPGLCSIKENVDPNRF